MCPCPCESHAVICDVAVSIVRLVQVVSDVCGFRD